MSSSSVSIMTSLQAHSPKMEKQQRGKLKNEALVKVGKRAPTFLGLGPFTQYDSDSWFVHVRGLLLSKQDMDDRQQWYCTSTMAAVRTENEKAQRKSRYALAFPSSFYETWRNMHNWLPRGLARTFPTILTDILDLKSRQRARLRSHWTMRLKIITGVFAPKKGGFFFPHLCGRTL